MHKSTPSYPVSISSVRALNTGFPSFIHILIRLCILHSVTLLIAIDAIAIYQYPPITRSALRLRQFAICVTASVMAIFLLYGLVAVLWTASALDVTWDENQAVIEPSNSDTAKENCSSWFEGISDYGIAPFASPGYRVFRNVKDYGANGDDDQDDTDAIIRAISDGGRCDLQTCSSSTRTPATVYFPSGTYHISKEIPVSYYTNLIGNPRCLPTLKATKNFTGNTVIMGRANGNFPSTNIFYRQIRNFIIDMTDLRHDMPPIDGTGSFPAIWWPTAQATSLQNIVFHMSEVPGTTHSGVFIEDGSGGWLSDLVFYGGGLAANWGSQQ